MQLHDIQSIKKDKKRIGRGGKRGTYSGKGMKGQKSRSGHNFEPIVRGLIKSYPKLRGYQNKAVKTIAEVNLSIIEKNFNVGDVVTPTTLIEKKLIRKIYGRLPIAKILGTGELTKKISFKEVLVSAPAKVKIEKAGGSVEVLNIKEIEKVEKKTTEKKVGVEKKKVIKKDLADKKTEKKVVKKAAKKVVKK